MSGIMMYGAPKRASEIYQLEPINTPLAITATCGRYIRRISSINMPLVKKPIIILGKRMLNVERPKAEILNFCKIMYGKFTTCKVEFCHCCQSQCQVAEAKALACSVWAIPGPILVICQLSMAIANSVNKPYATA